MSIADLPFALNLRHFFRLYLTEKHRNNYPNLSKWFNEVSAHPVIMKKFGKAWLCQKEFTPEYAPGK